MGTRYTTTITESTTAKVSWKCTNCGKEVTDSALIEVKGSSTTGGFTMRSHEDEREQNANQAANEAMYNRIASIITEAGRKQYLSAGLECQCPHCGNIEVWSQTHNTAIRRLDNAAVLLMFPTFIVAILLVATNWLLSLLFVLLFAGLIVTRICLKRADKKNTCEKTQSMDPANLPHIYIRGIGTICYEGDKAYAARKEATASKSNPPEIKQSNADSGNSPIDIANDIINDDGKSIICGHCRTTNMATNKKCWNCGKTLSVSVKKDATTQNMSSQLAFGSATVSKAAKHVVWRNEDGQIVCPGSSCPQDCGHDCPIYINTDAAMLMMNKNYTTAIELYEKAVKIAPDFYDAWNNMGGCYGGKGDYEKAYDCYLKASECNPNKPNPVYGLALSTRDLGKYDECLQWCDIYDDLCDDGRCNSIRDFVVAAKGKEALPDTDKSDAEELKEINMIKTAVDAPKEAAVENDKSSDVEERYGRAWLLIIGQTQIHDGLKIMKELDKEGYSEATVALGMFPESQEQRKQYVMKAADAGNIEGLWEYSGLLQHSYCPDPKNPNDALWENYCLNAAEGGSVDAMNEMGNVFNRRGKLIESAYWYAMARAHGHKSGEISLNGIARKWRLSGCPREFVAGSPRFDIPRHKCALAYLELYSDSEMTVSIDEIIKFVLDGVPIAAYLAGETFESTNNPEMAYKMYNAIAFENDPHGLKCYADMLLAGIGVEKDVESAMGFYKLAAEKGDREAMFITGEFSKDTNKYTAAYWYGLSHTRGYEPALSRLIELA